MNIDKAVLSALNISCEKSATLSSCSNKKMLHMFQLLAVFHAKSEKKILA